MNTLAFKIMWLDAVVSLFKHFYLFVCLFLANVMQHPSSLKMHCCSRSGSGLRVCVQNKCQSLKKKKTSEGKCEFLLIFYVLCFLVLLQQICTIKSGQHIGEYQ